MQWNSSAKISSLKFSKQTFRKLGFMKLIEILSVNSIAVEGLNHDKLIALVEKVKSQKGEIFF